MRIQDLDYDENHHDLGGLAPGTWLLHWTGIAENIPCMVLGRVRYLASDMVALLLDNGAQMFSWAISPVAVIPAPDDAPLLEDYRPARGLVPGDLVRQYLPGIRGHAHGDLSDLIRVKSGGQIAGGYGRLRVEVLEYGYGEKMYKGIIRPFAFVRVCGERRTFDTVREA